MSRDVTLTSIFSDGDDESASLQLGAVGHRPGHLARTGAGLPLLLLLFTFAPRPLLRSPGPGLSFRGIAQWSRTRAVTWCDSRGALH
jgi:hypothetical protein